MSKMSISQIANAASLVVTTAYNFKAEHHKVRSVSAVWTATTAAYSLSLEYSNDNVNWHLFVAATAIANAGGTVMWDVVESKDALYWRVNAARTSGTLTTLKAFVAYIER